MQLKRIAAISALTLILATGAANAKTPEMASIASKIDVSSLSKVVPADSVNNDRFNPSSVNTIAQDINNANNLDGTWDYQVNLPASQCSVQGACSIKIVGNLGEYVLPTGSSGVFLVNVYPTTINRGQPVVTITGIGIKGQEVSYTIAHSGRLDEPGLITGRFVDVINQQGTFTLKKRP